MRKKGFWFRVIVYTMIGGLVFSTIAMGLSAMLSY